MAIALSLIISVGIGFVLLRFNKRCDHPGIRLVAGAYLVASGLLSRPLPQLLLPLIALFLLTAATPGPQPTPALPPELNQTARIELPPAPLHGPPPYQATLSGSCGCCLMILAPPRRYGRYRATPTASQPTFHPMSNGWWVIVAPVKGLMLTYACSPPSHLSGSGPCP